jgi:hypothetical protein
MWTRVFACSGGQTIQWEIGQGGNGGSWSSRDGGKGGSGYIILKFFIA